MTENKLGESFNSSFYSELHWRRLLLSSAGPTELREWLNEKPRTLYAGFDPTADSLHVGHLVALMTLRRFQRAGHKPIALIGGATGMIGDPSGRSSERNLLSEESLAANVTALRAQIAQFLDFNTSRGSAVLVNNYDWMKDYGYLRFLRDIGKCFPVNMMLGKDSVKQRLEQSAAGMSYTEFSYMLLQAYDFVVLHRQYGCELQIGGSDQWGNITAGMDLSRRLDGAHLYGLTFNLLTKSDGEKMGKTASGAVWLSPERTSPYAFFQYWFNVADSDVGRCLRYFTEFSESEIKDLESAHLTDPGKRESQRRLAEEVTRLVHGDAGLQRAQRASSILFGAEIEGLSEKELTEIFADVPSKTLTPGVLETGFTLIDALVESGLVKSKSEARRSIEQKGAYVNNRCREDVNDKLTPADLVGTAVVLRKGKKSYAVLKFTE